MLPHHRGHSVPRELGCGSFVHSSIQQMRAEPPLWPATVLGGWWELATPTPRCPPEWGAREAGPGERGECPSSAQGDMEQALENYDVCTELLQGAAASGAEQGGVVVRLPNLHNDSVVSLEEVSRAPDLSLWTGRRARG